MLTANHFREDIISPILARFNDDQSLANAYCIIWAVDAYATHVALEGVATPENATELEGKFKKAAVDHSWQFRVIREASNATKHAIRKYNKKDKERQRVHDVSRSSDVQADTGMDWYAYFSDTDGGVTIKLDWQYLEERNVFIDSSGKVVEGYSGLGNEVYLSQIIAEAIEAIEFVASSS